MNTIDALEKDILLQIPSLSKFQPQPILSDEKQRHSIFCGSGDSLASCMLAQAFSEFKVRASDPLDLLKNKSIPKNHDVYVVSISGRTISNIKVANLARYSTAITSNPKSKLAKTCDNIIELKFPNSDVFTAGSISFLDSALTCISLVSDIRIKNADKLFNRALKQSKKIKLKNRVFFLGNLHTYPIAMYAAAKLYELLGMQAYYERLEQFSHMELFSVNRGDTVVILEEKTPHNYQLVKALQNVGLNVVHPDPKSKDKLAQVLFYTFLFYLTPLVMAKKRGQKDCHFVMAKKLRAASDKMIY